MIAWLLDNPWGIVIVQALIIVGLGYAFVSEVYAPIIEEEVRSDTTVVTKTDTVFQTRRDTIRLRVPDEPTRVIREATADTVVRRDTVYITSKPGVNFYDIPFWSGPLKGTVETTVEGRILDQRVTVEERDPIVYITRDTQINTTRTITRRGKWRPIIATTGGIQGGLSTAAIGIGLQRPGLISGMYQYDLLDGEHMVTLTAPIFTW